MEFKPKPDNTVSIKDALKMLIDDYGMTEQMKEAKILGNWEKVMGKAIANHTTNIFIKNNTLFLSIDSAPLKQELFFNKNKIKERLNELVGDLFIQEVVFR